MIELAQPRIREVLAQCRAAAYLGQPQVAIRRAEGLLSEISNAATVADRLAIGMFKAEILHLDGNGEDALRVFDSEIEPLLPSAPHEFQIIAGHNRSDISFGLLKPDDYYYLLLDEAKVAGVDLWNPQALYSATQDVAAGKPYESFPTFWQELLRTYHQGCWRAIRPVCKHMAQQCIRLNLVERAVYYAILAQEEETSRNIGGVLLQHGTHDLLSIAVKKVLACAQLKHHFLVGCDLLEAMMDAVPDEQVKDVCAWLLRRAVGTPEGHTDCDVVQSAWRVLAKLAARIDPDQAAQLVEAATTHPCWLAQPEQNRVNLVRKEIIAAVYQCVDKLSTAGVASLAVKAIPLATTHKQDFEYGETVNLLCRIAEHGEPDIKESLRTQLYPAGQQLNAILVQVAPAFGHPIHDRSSWAESAKQIAENIRLQVQRVPKDADPQPVRGSCMQHTATVGGDKLVCSITDTMDVHAIFRHREWVPSEALTEVVDAILDMIESADNILANKIALIQSLRHVSWPCSKKQQARLWKSLSSLAKGAIKEPAHVMSWAEANNPMNPFKMRSGNPSDVHGMSLFVLACLEKEHPGMFGAKLDEIIQLGLSDLDGNVRASAFAAAREKPTVSESVVVAILLGTRDLDEKAAAAAFYALANKSDLRLSRPQWRLLVQSIRFAKQNGSPRVRSAAAQAATRLMPAAPTGSLRQEMADSVGEFAKDTCHSVRSKTKSP